MSRTYVVAADGLKGGSEVAEVPDFMNLFKLYITEPCPSTTTGSTTVHVWALMSRTCVGIAASKEPVAKTRPSGRTKRWGYSGRGFEAPESCDHVLVAGS